MKEGGGVKDPRPESEAERQKQSQRRNDVRLGLGTKLLLGHRASRSAETRRTKAPTQVVTRVGRRTEHGGRQLGLEVKMRHECSLVGWGGSTVRNQQGLAL